MNNKYNRIVIFIPDWNRADQAVRAIQSGFVVLLSAMFAERILFVLLDNSDMKSVIHLNLAAFSKWTDILTLPTATLILHSRKNIETMFDKMAVFLIVLTYMRLIALNWGVFCI